MKYVLAGASGFLGTALARDLTADGHQVVRLVRRTPANRTRSAGTPPAVTWIRPPSATPTCWSTWPARTSAARGPRRTGRCSARAGSARPPPWRTRRTARAPAGLITQSGIGGYGLDCGDRILTEDSELGDGFLADVVRVWEGALEPARAAGCRVAAIRTGIVLDRRAPAFQLLSLPFRARPRRSSGPRHAVLPDRLPHRLAPRCPPRRRKRRLSGPVNVTPTPVTNAGIHRGPGHRPPPPGPDPCPGLPHQGSPRRIRLGTPRQQTIPPHPPRIHGLHLPPPHPPMPSPPP